MTTAFQHRPMSAILAPEPEAPREPGQAAPQPAAPVAPEAIPDKYQNKSVEDVIKMHQNAESRLGEIQNEVGQLRGLVTDLSAIQRTPEPPPPVVEDVTVSGDELLADPVAAIKSIVQPALDARDATAADDRMSVQVGTESNALMRDFPTMNATVASEGFQQFAARTAGRQADFNVAATGEGLNQVRAARRLLEDYQDFQQALAPPEPGPTPTEQARAAITEGAHTGAPISTKPQIFESDVIALINSDPARYRSPSYQAELLGAMKEGRFVKNT